MAFKIKVDGFVEGGSIPRRLTCDGEDISPALDWTGEPLGAKSFALIVDDPDAPGGPWNHWLVWDIPASTHSLPENIAQGSIGKSGTNDLGEIGIRRALSSAGQRSAPVLFPALCPGHTFTRISCWGQPARP